MAQTEADRAEYKKQWYARKLAEDPEGLRKRRAEISAKWRANNPGRPAELCKRWRDKQDPEVLKAKWAEFYEKNKDARRAYARQYAEDHKEERKAKALAREAANPGATKAHKRALRARKPERTMLKAAQKNAKDKGVEFNLELSDIAIPTHCPVLGLELKRGEGRFCDTSPSIDRILPAKGYTKGNIIVVSWLANRIKTNAVAADILRVGQFYSGLTPQ